jgi:hypothetical protein
MFGKPRMARLNAYRLGIGRDFTGRNCAVVDGDDGGKIVESGEAMTVWHAANAKG